MKFWRLTKGLKKNIWSASSSLDLSASISNFSKLRLPTVGNSTEKITGRLSDSAKTEKPFMKMSTVKTGRSRRISAILTSELASIAFSQTMLQRKQLWLKSMYLQWLRLSLLNEKNVVPQIGQYRTEVAWLDRRRKTAVLTRQRRPAGVGHRLGGRTGEKAAARSRRTKNEERRRDSVAK